MSSTPEFLIVYGTLQSAFMNPYAQLLHKRSRYVAPGMFTGSLYDLGDYPGAIYLPNSATYVHGSVYDIGQHRERILAELDYYEGVRSAFEQPTEYIRTTIPVQCDREFITCWVYLYNLPVNEQALIPTGDYLAYQQRKSHNRKE